MPDTIEDVVVYWIPGCGNCTRLKGYLADRGIDYVSVDVQHDVEAFEAARSAGILSLPVVRVGDRWAPGFDLKEVDALLGLTGDRSAATLGVGELVDRAARMLEVVATIAAQVPAEHLDDPTPTMDQFGAPFLFLRDGTPWVPHPTSKLLVHHIVGHAEKFLRIGRAADGVHEMGFGMAIDGEDTSFGEPEPATPMYRVIDRLRLWAKDLRAWWQTKSVCDESMLVDTHYGPQTVQQLLQTATCSIAQHCRQLSEIVSGLGITPAATIEDSDLAGLQMPSTVWG